MADFPASRVTPASRPFVCCDIDYAGPFNIRESKKKGNIPLTKAYVAVFICLKDKAVHLELVSNLTIKTFMAAFKRFCARRGSPMHVYSDNSTDLVGAANELKKVYELLQQNEQTIALDCATQNIHWHFIPPRSPYFGGLREAAVKSVKRHLKTIMKNLHYTYEEYYTTLVEIEGILNSRPLTASSADPNDFAPLTPVHFLIGESLKRLVEINYLEIKDNYFVPLAAYTKVKTRFLAAVA